MVLTYSPLSLTSVMDDVYDDLRRHVVERPMNSLAVALLAARNDRTPADWKRIATECLSHPLRDLVHQDPFTWRCFSKPRGYAGDAVMLDHAYSEGAIARQSAHVTPLGKAINAYATTARPSVRAVRFRRDLVAAEIDDISNEFATPRIVSIAAGHARELDRSHAFRERRLGSFTAVDQDTESLAEIVRHHPRRQDVHTCAASVRQLLTGRIRFADAHFVYASGLFDYLGDSTARTLTSLMFEALAPGGRLLFANFLTNIADAGYMETFMAWELNFRSPAEVMSLADGLGPRATPEYLEDPDRNIGFVIVRKR